MYTSNYITVKNDSAAIRLADIPLLPYDDFYLTTIELLENPDNHCTAYYVAPMGDKHRFFCCIAMDSPGTIAILSHETKDIRKNYASLTEKIPAMHIFEREIHELFGTRFEGHPWLKPVRFPANAAIGHDQYPFYRIESEELHEVGVGPVHAGVIEPGHFRFICNGEKVLHLEIHLGYQHRGVEALMLRKKTMLERMVLAEGIAGDTAIGHGWAHAAVIESLAEIPAHAGLNMERSMALELERIAIHIGDTAALCTDVAYQLGQVVNEALRTTIINTTQAWCGNRFGKGLIRVGGSHYPLNPEFIAEMLHVLEDSGNRYKSITDRIYSLPSLLRRFDGIGIVTTQQVKEIGATGMAARMAGLLRDVRHSHPFGAYNRENFTALTEQTGDVLARGMLRNREARSSINMIVQWVKDYESQNLSGINPAKEMKLQPDAFAISLKEGWRGEICHCAITNNQGDLLHYKIKDPSMHNWFALALAVRDQEISDFPVNNKSFNLSYCGNDL